MSREVLTKHVAKNDYVKHSSVNRTSGKASSGRGYDVFDNDTQKSFVKSLSEAALLDLQQIFSFAFSVSYL
ncbi:MAG: hypothetical protein QNL62_21505 [Gammaproteobacteria bacterium]|nr:hypothetical protein [Gammaproteobacteria bacterium]